MFGLAALAIAITAVFGTQVDDTNTARIVPPYFTKYVSECSALDDIYVHVDTRTIYGDQDHNGRLEGDECNWK
jgi:hypothetical protein